VRPRVDGGRTPAARWRSDEHGHREIVGEGANRGASQVTGVEAKFTGAKDTTGTRRRPRNMPETTADRSGVSLVRAWCETGAGVLRVRE
jgi:hypothetical protein